jgi:hypothetical protein
MIMNKPVHATRSLFPGGHNQQTLITKKAKIRFQGIHGIVDPPLPPVPPTTNNLTNESISKPTASSDHSDDGPSTSEPGSSSDLAADSVEEKTAHQDSNDSKDQNSHSDGQGNSERDKRDGYLIPIAIAFAVFVAGSLFTLLENKKQLEFTLLENKEQLEASRIENAKLIAAGNLSEVKAQGMAVAINKFAIHTETMASEKSALHVPRTFAGKGLTIKEFLNDREHNYAMIHGPHGGGKSEEVLAALRESDGTLRPGVLKIKVMGAAEDLSGLICRQLKVAKDCENDLVEILQGVRANFRDLMPVIIIELDRLACTPEQINTTSTLAKDLSVDQQLCKVLIVLSDNAAVHTITKGRGDSRKKMIWVGDLSPELARKLLQVRKFDPREVGYGKVDDVDDEEGCKQLFAHVGTRPEVLVGLASSMQQGRMRGQEMAAAEGIPVREAEKREAKKAVQEDIQGREKTVAENLRLLVLFDPAGDQKLARQKKLTIDVITRLLQAREVADKQGVVEFEPQIADSDTDLPPSVMSGFMRGINSECYPLIYNPPSESYRFHSVMAEKAAREWQEREEAEKEAEKKREEAEKEAEKKREEAERSWMKKLIIRLGLS